MANVNGKATACDTTQPLFRIEPEIFHKTKEPLNTSLNQHFSSFCEFLLLCDQKNIHCDLYKGILCKKKKSAKIRQILRKQFLKSPYLDNKFQQVIKIEQKSWIFKNFPQIKPVAKFG